MTSPGSAAFSAQVDAVLAEQRQSLNALRQQSAERAARGTAAAAKATERFSRLAQRVREGARERANPAPAKPAAGDDKVAELELLAGQLDETPPDPAEPSDAEVSDILDGMRPLPPEPAEAAPEQADTSILQWSESEDETDDEPDDLDDDDFQNPW